MLLKKMHELLNSATKKGDFEFLTAKEIEELENFTQIVKKYENANFIIETPQTVQELITFKMF